MFALACLLWVIGTGCATLRPISAKEQAPSVDEALYQRTADEFATALFFKPRSRSTTDFDPYLAPLIVQEVDEGDQAPPVT